MSYGTVNADVIGTSVAGSNLGAGNASIMKNRIINGAMVIDQRNAGASVANTTSYLFGTDRWKFFGTVSSKFTCQQNAGSVTPPIGFTNYLGITSSAATTISSGDYYLVQQKSFIPCPIYFINTDYASKEKPLNEKTRNIP